LAAFREDQLYRYSRNILLKEVGAAGQSRLLASRVLVIGAGGLGSPLLLYLAAAGVGAIGIVDDEAVELSNLQRQILNTTASIGAAKVDSAASALQALNPDVTIERHRLRLDAGNAQALIEGYDIVADGSDSIETRYAVNEACHRAGRILVSAAVVQFDGQLTTLKSHLAGDHPCYRCLFPAPPAPGLTPTCSGAGVLGAAAGTMGTLQATEIVKELLGIGDSLSGRLLLYDALSANFQKIRYHRRTDCPVCGRRAAK
jgi:adenylyltransferase/sulfurtransferase